MPKYSRKSVRLSRIPWMVVAILVLAAGPIPDRIHAEQPTKKRLKKRQVVPKKSKAVPGQKARVRRVQPNKAYVRPRKSYSHVRVLHPHRHDDGRLKTRPLIARSARVTPAVLHQFETRRQRQINLIIQLIQEGRRAKAIRMWGDFLEGLVDYREPVDLDDVMLLISREGCGMKDSALRFQAAKLEYLQSSAVRAADYLDLVMEQRKTCRQRPGLCPPGMRRDLESELVRARTDRDVFLVEERVTQEKFDRLVESSGEYEHQFAATMDGLYREVELRIQFTP